jgi:carbonic anhydrase
MDFPARLADGYRTFRANRLPTEQDRFRNLAESGQKPETMIIGCCDSRVSPEVIFDAAPGELFVTRNVANLVPPYTPDGSQRAVSAALEFAVQALKVKHIVVLGHARCGGIKAYAEQAQPLSPGDFIGRWMELIEPAAREAGPPRPGETEEAFLRRLEQAAIRHTLNNLMTFPCVKILVDRGRLALHGAYFGVATGMLSVLDPATNRFELLPSDDELAAALDRAH